MLTAAEWLSENSERQELAVMNIPLAMEAYARYYASFVPDDVEKAIDAKYLYLERQEGLTYSSFKLHNDHADFLRTAARYGYSLAAGESVRFAEWIREKNWKPYQGIYKSVHWTNSVTYAYATNEQLHELFKKESNG